MLNSLTGYDNKNVFIDDDTIIYFDDIEKLDVDTLTSVNIEDISTPPYIPIKGGFSRRCTIDNSNKLIMSINFDRADNGFIKEVYYELDNHSLKPGIFNYKNIFVIKHDNLQPIDYVSCIVDRFNGVSINPSIYAGNSIMSIDLYTEYYRSPHIKSICNYITIRYKQDLLHHINHTPYSNIYIENILVEKKILLMDIKGIFLSKYGYLLIAFKDDRDYKYKDREEYTKDDLYDTSCL